MNNLKSPEEILEENGYIVEDLTECGTILLRNPDYSTAIIGVSEEHQVIYDYEKMIEYLTKYDNMSYNDAVDYICYNTIRTIPYIHGNKPIIMYPIVQD